jgi:hypothetical protein
MCEYRAEDGWKELREAHVDRESLEKEVDIWGLEILNHFGIRCS